MEVRIVRVSALQCSAHIAMNAQTRVGLWTAERFSIVTAFTRELGRTSSSPPTSRSVCISRTGGPTPKSAFRGRVWATTSRAATLLGLRLRSPPCDRRHRRQRAARSRALRSRSAVTAS